MERAETRCARQPILRWRIMLGESWLDLVEEKATGDKRLFVGRLNGQEVARGNDAASTSGELIRHALR